MAIRGSDEWRAKISSALMGRTRNGQHRYAAYKRLYMRYWRAGVRFPRSYRPVLVDPETLWEGVWYGEWDAQSGPLTVSAIPGASASRTGMALETAIRPGHAPVADE